MIGVNEAQINALLFCLGPEHVSAPGDVYRNCIEELVGRDAIAEIAHGARKYLREAMGAQRHLPDAIWPIIDSKHRCNDRQQNLRGTDIARRLFAADVLFACGESQTKCAISVRVLRLTDNATG
jgi:hypothetical protein